MWGAGAGPSVPSMHKLTLIRILCGGVAVALLASLAIAAPWADTGQASSKTKTLRFFSTPQSFTFTTADGTVTQQPPQGEPQPGDVLEVASQGFAGDHRRHAKRATASDYVRCEFGQSGAPACEGYAAVDGSLLRFRDMTVIGGAGRFLGTTGKVTNTEVEGGSDVVVRLRLP